METKGKHVTDLAVVDFDIVDITDEEIIRNGLADLKDRFTDISDPTTKEGYEKNRSGVEVMRTLRGKVTAKIKEKKAPVLKKQKQLIIIEKWILGDVLALEEPMKEKNKAHDEKIAKEKADKAMAEEERIDTIAKRIEDIRLSPITNMDNDSSRLSDILLMVKNELIDVSWADEKVEQAQDVIGEAITRLEQLITNKEAQEEITRQQKEAAEKLEADQKAAIEKADSERMEQDLKNKAESDRLEKERADFEAEKNEAREKQEVIEKAAEDKEQSRLAKIKEEDDARAAKIKAEDDAAKEKEASRIAAIKKEDDEKAAKAKAEQDKKDAEAKAKADKEEEDRNAFIAQENLSTRIGEAAAQIQSLLDSDNADTSFEIVTAIINGKIPHVTFT